MHTRTQGHGGEGNEFLLNRGVSVICSGEFCLLLLCLSSGRSQEVGRKKKASKLEWLQVQGGKTEHPYLRQVTEPVRTGLSFICVLIEVVRYYLITVNF